MFLEILVTYIFVPKITHTDTKRETDTHTDTQEINYDSLLNHHEAGSRDISHKNLYSAISLTQLH